ncbi:hypothetical protein TSOC_007818 [Tetrabaena socialis]|uniref:Uncharacterized protein n=1 Tax=Tetrabaena socialis TaxID=47790 RepID=A0A2J8A064_9CHLO|nr:hypothetical protein TSOC_007818 [Tetrabaena socialis]|eukprot:PNH05878.1 hypothetical protein TSOC_007818 [Tetrabaena socialis]
MFASDSATASRIRATSGSSGSLSWKKHVSRADVKAVALVCERHTATSMPPVSPPSRELKQAALMGRSRSASSAAAPWSTKSSASARPSASAATCRSGRARDQEEEALGLVDEAFCGELLALAEACMMPRMAPRCHERIPANGSTTRAFSACHGAQEWPPLAARVITSSSPRAPQKCTVVILPAPISNTMSTASLSATWPKRVM